jgi:H+/gluconate symporter-like permease
VIAAAIAIVFAIFAMLMYRRLLPAILALPLMAVVMALVAGVPFAALGTIVVSGASDLSQVYIAVIFGALLGRVTMDTGIARAMVNLAAEYGGERPFALAMVLCAIVAVLFTSLSGLGAIIMVGSIVLPIMMTVGVPRTVAATLFLMSFALGFIFNIANWTFYTKYFNVAQEQMVRYAVVLAVIDAVVLVTYAVVAFRREREYATWAVRAENGPAPRVHAVALLTPVLPILLYYALKMPATPAFMLSALFGVLVTRPREAVQTLVAAAIRGVEDVAPAVLLFVGIGMLLVATQQPQFAAALKPLAGGWIANPALYVLVFGVASPLSLYRGPLNPFGVGIAIFTVLLAANVVPPVVLVAAIMAVVQVQNVCDPTNTANVWVANFTGVQIDTITKRTLPFQVAVAIAATLAVVLAAPQLFGVPAFHWSMPAARADTIDGFYAPDGANGHIGIGDDGTPLGRVAAGVVAQDLRSNGRQVLLVRDDPNDGDCARKPYAAYVHVAVSQFTLIEGDDVDVGLRLEDCGGWVVQEWHDHRIVAAAASDEAVRGLAIEGAARLRAWSAADLGHSSSLFSRGVASAPGDPPTYFLALFKTVDGNMRAYVRGGGPAYAAGLRSGDVVNKIDGKFWWEYGTFQTQLRAYDGKPHSFEVRRGSRTLDVQLGAPFVPATGGTS